MISRKSSFDVYNFCFPLLNYQGIECHKITRSKKSFDISLQYTHKRSRDTRGHGANETVASVGLSLHG